MTSLENTKKRVGNNGEEGGRRGARTFLNVELKAVGNEKTATKDRDGNNTVKKGWDNNWFVSIPRC